MSLTLDEVDKVMSRNGYKRLHYDGVTHYWGKTVDGNPHHKHPDGGPHISTWDGITEEELRGQFRKVNVTPDF